MSSLKSLNIKIYLLISGLIITLLATIAFFYIVFTSMAEKEKTDLLEGVGAKILRLVNLELNKSTKNNKNNDLQINIKQDLDSV